jgi:hypothetical protein
MQGMISRDVTLWFKLVPKRWEIRFSHGCGEPYSLNDKAASFRGFSTPPLVTAKDVGNATVIGITGEPWGDCESLAIAYSRDRFRQFPGYPGESDGAAHPRIRRS